MAERKFSNPTIVEESFSRGNSTRSYNMLDITDFKRVHYIVLSVDLPESFQFPLRKEMVKEM